MNLQQLHTFVAVSEHESIRSAARALNISQPSVTRTMRELEKSVGAPLLLRGTKGVELTIFGLALLRRTHIILEEARRAQDELDQMQDGSGGVLNVAITSTVAVSVFSKALRAFRNHMPRVELAVSEASHSHVQQRLETERVDLMVLTEIEGGQIDNLCRTRLFSTQLHVVGNVDHPLRYVTSLDDLRDALWLVAGPGYPSTEHLKCIYRLSDVSPPHDVISCQSLVVALSIMKSSDALAIFSSEILQSSLVGEDLVSFGISRYLPKAQVSLISSGSPTPASTFFTQCMLDAVSEQSC